MPLLKVNSWYPFDVIIMSLTIHSQPTKTGYCFPTEFHTQPRCDAHAADRFGVSCTFAYSLRRDDGLLNVVVDTGFNVCLCS
jgi:hypothetical protein